MLASKKINIVQYKKKYYCATIHTQIKINDFLKRKILTIENRNKLGG